VGAGVSFCTAAGKEQTVRVRQQVTRQAVDAYAQLTGEILSVAGSPLMLYYKQPFKNVSCFTLTAVPKVASGYLFLSTKIFPFSI
jgi:hypothetical protein